MSLYTSLTIILPLAAQALAQGLCVAAAGEAGSGMFVVGLSPTGEAPATHYISSGGIETQFADILPITTGEGEITKSTGNIAAVMYIVASSGDEMPESMITDLFDQLDVSYQLPFEAMARCGLQLVTEQQE